MENDSITLSEWFVTHNVNKDSEQKNYMVLFYNMDKEMKKLHNRGYYISSFNINAIEVNNKKITYKLISEMPKSDDDFYINDNIYYLSCLALGIYNNCLPYINPGNKELLRDNYIEFSAFIPDEVKAYYKGIFERNATVYLSDYMDAKLQRDIEKEKDLLDSIGGRGQSYKKSTEAGKLYDNDNNNIAAFAFIYIFPAVIFLLALIIPIIIILSSK